MRLFRLSFVFLFFAAFGASLRAQSPEKKYAIQLKQILEVENNKFKFALTKSKPEKFFFYPSADFVAWAATEYGDTEVRVFTDVKGVRTEITGNSATEIAEKLNSEMARNKFDKFEILGNEITFGKNKGTHELGVANGNQSAASFAKYSLVSDALRRAILVRRARSGKVDAPRKCYNIVQRIQAFLSDLDRKALKQLEKIGLNDSRLAGLEASLGIGLQVAQHSYLKEEQRKAFARYSQRRVEQKLDLWKRLQAKKESDRLLEAETSIAISATLSAFQDVELILTPEVRDQLLWIQGGKDIDGETRAGKLHKLAAKVQKEIAAQQKVMRDFDNLPKSNKSETEKQKIINEMAKLNEKLNTFSLRVPSKDLQAYQKFRRDHFKDLPTPTDIAKSTSLSDDDKAMYFAFEHDLVEAYNLYLYRDEFDQIVNSFTASIVESERLAKALESVWNQSGTNSVQALTEEYNFIQSIPEELRDDSILKRKSQLESMIDYAKKHEWHDLANLYLDQLRTQWEKFYQITIVGIPDERIEAIRSPQDLELKSLDFEEALLRPSK